MREFLTTWAGGGAKLARIGNHWSGGTQRRFDRKQWLGVSDHKHNSDDDDNGEVSSNRCLCPQRRDT